MPLIGDGDVVHPVVVGESDFGGVGAVVELHDHAFDVGLENGGGCAGVAGASVVVDEDGALGELIGWGGELHGVSMRFFVGGSMLGDANGRFWFFKRGGQDEK